MVVVAAGLAGLLPAGCDGGRRAWAILAWHAASEEATVPSLHSKLADGDADTVAASVTCV
jgi:hypothetical protein